MGSAGKLNYNINKFIVKFQVELPTEFHWTLPVALKWEGCSQKIQNVKDGAIIKIWIIDREYRM